MALAPGFHLNFDLPDFKRQLAAFGAQFERFAVRSASNRAAQVFKSAVIAAAPILRKPRVGRDVGTLKRSIYVVRSKDSTRGREHYVVGFRQGRKAGKRGLDAFYGKFLEGGWIPRGPGRRIRGGKRTVALQRERMSHLKITKYRFISPGFQRAARPALDAFNKRIEELLNRERGIRR